MAICEMQLHSPALERPVPYTLILPDPRLAGSGPYAVLVQLHGYWDDHHAWIYKSNLAVYVERLPLIVVLPNGENGYWINWDPARHYEDLIMQDLGEHVQRTFPVRPGRWAIGGLSMGGYGAIRLGLKYPDRFCSIYAHSSFIPGPPEFQEWAGRGDWFVAQARRLNSEADLDCTHWATQGDPAQRPRLSFDCGTDDQLLGQNRRFHDFLVAQQIPHHYAEYPGGHTWDYWDRHVPAALRQHAEVLGITFRPDNPPPAE